MVRPISQKKQQYMSMVWTCVFKFNCWKNHPRYVRLVNWAKKNGYMCEWHPGPKIDCKTDNHIPLVVPGVPSTEHQTKAVGERKQAQVVGDHERRVQKEKYQYGFNHSRMDWQGDLQVRQTYLQRTWNTTAKTSSLRASSGEAYFEQSRKKTQFIHSLS